MTVTDKVQTEVADIYHVDVGELRMEYRPVHGVQDRDKLEELVRSMERDGWRGPPLVADGYQLITGAHRFEAVDVLRHRFEAFEGEAESRIEEGRARVRAKTARKIAAALGTTVAGLTKGMSEDTALRQSTAAKLSTRGAACWETEIP